MRFVLALTVVVVAGCATNSGIVDLGGGNYVYEKEDFWAYNGNSTKVQILKEATSFCAKQGKQISVQSSDAKPYTRIHPMLVLKSNSAANNTY